MKTLGQLFEELEEGFSQFVEPLKMISYFDSWNAELVLCVEHLQKPYSEDDLNQVSKIKELLARLEKEMTEYRSKLECDFSGARSQAEIGVRAQIAYRR